ncbi:MAG: epimerase, partial [Candidatus Eremiobacteraeota bacterium]|nr:epimerase [Candidatus Eremiobacteraeota bacterium]
MGKNVLIIGGTRFLGRHLVAALLAAGHVPTLFNSGNHRADAPPSVEQIHGDRERDLQRLGDRTWDAVVDTCGFYPKSLEISARHLRARTQQYVFISTVSALDLSQPDCTENTPRLPMPEGASRTEMIPESYGPLKGLCEDVVASTFRNRALIVRPGLIVGPYDPSDRFTYWPVRMARGGTVLAPVGPDIFVQLIDARDLATWIVLQIEHRTTGAINVTGPPHTHTLGSVLAACAKEANVTAQIEWASEDFLAQQEIGDWIDLPLWIASKTKMPGLNTVDISRALATGLRLRTLRQTAHDTLMWA